MYNADPYGRFSLTGRLLHIHLKPAHGQPMRAVREALAVEARGLEGDNAFGRRSRQVLLIEAETLERFGLAPGAVRENLTVSGMRLVDLPPGSILEVGAARLQIRGDCEPCSQMDALRPGLQDALRGQRGMLANVKHGGRIRVGDPVRLLETES